MKIYFQSSSSPSSISSHWPTARLASATKSHAILEVAINLLLALGLIPNGRMQSIQGMQILPADYLSPKDYRTGNLQRTSHTYSIHHYDASWLSKSERRWMRLQQVIGPSLYEKVRHKWDRLRYHLGRLHL